VNRPPAAAFFVFGLEKETTAMRLATYLACFILLPAQITRADVKIPAAGEHQGAGEVRAVAQQLVDLLASRAAELSPLETAMANSNLGVIYQDLGDSIRAEHAYLRARAILEPENSRAEYRTLWARTLNNLASMYVETGQYGKAERLVATVEKSEALDQDDAARLRGTMAGLHRVRGRLREAEEGYLSLLAWWEKKGNHREGAIVMNNLGVLSFDRNDPRTAAARFREAVELWRRTGNGEHPASMIATANYGSSLLATGKAREAVELLGKAVSMARHWHGDAAPVTAQITTLWAHALEANGEKTHARKIRTELKNVRSFVPVNPGQHTVDILDLAEEK
jgi:tetratricopeptide (TPR) repeat protein